MTAIGVGSIAAGQSMARVKGATRDVYAAIRHARSTALVTGQRVLVNYSNGKADDEVCVKIEVVAAKIMNADGNRPKPTPYWVEDYKDLPQQKTKLVNVRESEAKPLAAAGGLGDETATDGGETLEEILFSPMDTSVVKGMRILVKKGDEALAEETAEQSRSRISVFSSVDYLQSRYKEAKKSGEAASSPLQDGDGSSSKGGGDAASPSGGSVNDMDGEVSVVWETNGAVEPHKIWIYPDGKKPEDGLMLNIDSFGAVRVLGGDGSDEE